MIAAWRVYGTTTFLELRALQRVQYDRSLPPQSRAHAAAVHESAIPRGNVPVGSGVEANFARNDLELNEKGGDQGFMRRQGATRTVVLRELCLALLDCHLGVVVPVAAG